MPEQSTAVGPMEQWLDENMKLNIGGAGPAAYTFNRYELEAFAREQDAIRARLEADKAHLESEFVTAHEQIAELVTALKGAQIWLETLVITRVLNGDGEMTKVWDSQAFQISHVAIINALAKAESR